MHVPQFLTWMKSDVSLRRFYEGQKTSRHYPPSPYSDKIGEQNYKALEQTIRAEVDHFKRALISSNSAENDGNWSYFRLLHDPKTEYLLKVRIF